MLFAAYLVLAFISPAGLGLGDVKFSGAIGLLLGWYGWPYLIVGTVAAFVLNGLVALVALARVGRKAEVPFGPTMIAGAVLALAAGPQLFG